MDDFTVLLAALSSSATTSNEAYFLSTYRQQEWSLPDSVIYYISKNPSTPKCYEKMIQSCKHFFAKNPILIVQRLYFEYFETERKIELNGKLVNFENFQSKKIWVQNAFDIFNDDAIKSNFLSTIIPKIYQSNIFDLTLTNQNISLNDLKFLASKAQEIHFDDITIINENKNDIVPLEIIVEVLPCITIIDFNVGENAAKTITSTTVSELLKIQHFFNIKHFYLSEIHEAFEIDAFFGNFVKKIKNADITFIFGEQICQAYKARLQRILDEILAIKNREYKIPLIRFPRITQSSFAQLCKLYDKNFRF